MLTDDFKAVIDYFCATEKQRGKKDSTIYGQSCSAANFLFELQANGVESPRKISQEAILSVFVAPDGRLKRGNSCKGSIKAVFNACIPNDPETFTKILTFIPEVKRTRKNIQYLLPEEISRIKQVIHGKHSPLSLRDKAIGVLAMYTGLRSGDISGLKFDSIDWEKDIICFAQEKTDVPIELPLTAIVGNAIYEYLESERPNSDCEYIFVTKRGPDRRLDDLWYISDIIMDAAGIRKAKGDRRGFHIFRHRLATCLLEKGIARPIISSILGHMSPNSLDTYLSADFPYLKTCALSIEKFPINREVSENA
jgi:integrase